MNKFKFYWLAIKRGEDFDKFTKEQLPQVWLFNHIGILFNLGLFILIPNFLKWILFIVFLFYFYRMICFAKYLKVNNHTFHLRKKKRSQS